MCKCRVRKIRERLTGDVREVLTGPIRSVQSGTPGCEKGFVKCFLNVPLAYLCSTAAAVHPTACGTLTKPFSQSDVSDCIGGTEQKSITHRNPILNLHLFRGALANELDTQMFILRNVAKQINREGGFIQRLIPALQQDSLVWYVMCGDIWCRIGNVIMQYSPLQSIQPIFHFLCDILCPHTVFRALLTS